MVAPLWYQKVINLKCSEYCLLFQLRYLGNLVLNSSFSVLYWLHIRWTCCLWGSLIVIRWLWFTKCRVDLIYSVLSKSVLFFSFSRSFTVSFRRPPFTSIRKIIPLKFKSIALYLQILWLGIVVDGLHFWKLHFNINESQRQHHKVPFLSSSCSSSLHVHSFHCHSFTLFAILWITCTLYWLSKIFAIKLGTPPPLLLPLFVTRTLALIYI